MKNTGKRFLKKHKGKSWVTVIVSSVVIMGSIASANHIEAETETQTSPVESYRIKIGDTLYSLAKAIGFPVEEIASQNGIEDVDVIKAGQELQLTTEPAAVKVAAESDSNQTTLDTGVENVETPAPEVSINEEQDTQTGANQDVAVLEKIDQESAEVKYQKAGQGTVTAANAQGTYDVLKTSPHQHLVSNPTNLTAEMIDYYMRTVDLFELNEAFGQLLNEAREEQGSDALAYMPNYQPGANVRATELASIGNIYINGVAHTRLDGRNYDTAYDYLGVNKGGMGENLTGINYDGNPYELVSERYLAEEAYKQWVNSTSHKVNQENPEYDGFALSIVPINNAEWATGIYHSGYIAALALVAYK